jgi:ankyrin repeat protein
LLWNFDTVVFPPAALAIDGQTPLHVAAAFGNIDALKILFEMGGANTTAWVRCALFYCLEVSNMNTLFAHL